LRKNILLIVLLLSSIFLGGCLAGNIKGQVIDTRDRPVVGAIVTTDPPTHSVRTTEHGYTLKAVPVGEYVIEAQKPGYQRGKERVLVQFSSTTDADIQIEKK